jgi:hypothetical protein
MREGEKNEGFFAALRCDERKEAYLLVSVDVLYESRHKCSRCSAASAGTSSNPGGTP